MQNLDQSSKTQEGGGLWRPITVPLLLAAAYAGVGANMQGFFSLLPVISDEFALSRARAGLFSSFYFLSATAIAIFSGRLTDIFGARRGLLAGVAGIGVLMLAISFAPHYGFILGLAFVCGVVFSVITPSVSRGIMENTPAERRAFSMGIAHSGGNIGGMAAAATLPIIAGYLGWRTAISASAVFALCAAAVIGLRYPADAGRSLRTGGEHEPGANFRESFRRLISNRRFLAVCGLGALLGCAMSSVGLHFTLFLSDDFLLSPVRAGTGLAVLQFGAIAGMPGWGLISDRVMGGDRNRTLCMATSGIAVVCLFVAFAPRIAPASYFFVLVLSLVIGFACVGTMGLFFTAISESVEMQGAGMATGMALIFSRAGIIFGPPLFGKMADVTGSYAASWLALGIAAACFTAAFAVFSAFDPAGPDGRKRGKKQGH